jgi:hypothetical protein
VAGECFAGKEQGVSGPSEVEIKAQEFVDQNKDALYAGAPLTAGVVAHEGLLLSIELQDQVVEAANEYRAAFDKVRMLAHKRGVSAGEAAAVEARLPELRETYERKHELSLELGELTDRAVEIVEGTQQGEDEIDAGKGLSFEEAFAEAPRRDGFLARAFRLLGKRG